MFKKKVTNILIAIVLISASILQFIIIPKYMNHHPKQEQNSSFVFDFQNSDQASFSRWNSSIIGLPFDPKKKQRLVIIGAGPTGLGAAHRLYELGIMRAKTQVVILEKQDKPGGLAVSQRDSNGFLWDMGGHVVFSHYKYFDNVLDNAVSKWNQHKRAAYAFMKGSSGKRSFIPYPVQDNILSMDKKEQQTILKDLEQLIKNPVTKKPDNFDEWLLKNFGKELSDVFMRRYNQKVWTVDPKEMNSVWVGERVAVPSLMKIKENYAGRKDSAWGPNRFFRFPRYNGTGGIWQSVADLLPQGWFHFKQNVTEIDIKKKQLKIVVDSKSESQYTLQYDILLTTSPLDVLVNMDKTDDFVEKKNSANELVYSHTHVVGVGLKGKPPTFLADKSWIYFPDSDSPFYRVTLFSKYSDDHVPNPAAHWSLMCEAAEPKHSSNSDNWSEQYLLDKTVAALIDYGFITKDQVISKFYHQLDHGYPVPSLSRERIIAELQPWLQSQGIYSRGRFGGWRYEVGNQDHSFMQGVELADYIARSIPEETYTDPNLVNSMKCSNRSIKHSITSVVPRYEVVVAQYNEDVQWLLPEEAGHCHIYYKGKGTIPDLRFKQWQKLPNVGRESHTYLYHVINNYDTLANVTVFVQGGNDHQVYRYPRLADYVNEALEKSYSARDAHFYNSWGRVRHEGKWLKELKSGKMRRSNYTIGEFWAKAIGTPLPPSTLVHYGAFFAVTRERIHANPLGYYKHLISFINDHRNPEEGHYFERLWHAVFFRY